MATQSPVAAKVETPHAQPPLKPNAPWWRWAVAAGPPTVLTALHARFYGAWIVDDAGITFGYARSIATGAGPVLQPGADEVEGYSALPVLECVDAVGEVAAVEK